MGKIAIILTFLILVHSTAINENRKHVHIYSNQKHLQNELAKIWIEKDGKKCIEVEYSLLDSKIEESIIQTITENWDLLIHQIELVFNGNKIKIIKL